MTIAHQVAQHLAGGAIAAASVVLTGGVALLVTIYASRRRCTRQRAANTTRSTR